MIRRTICIPSVWFACVAAVVLARPDLAQSNLLVNSWGATGPAPDGSTLPTVVALRLPRMAVCSSWTLATGASRRSTRAAPSSTNGYSREQLRAVRGASGDCL